MMNNARGWIHPYSYCGNNSWYFIIPTPEDYLITLDCKISEYYKVNRNGRIYNPFFDFNFNRRLFLLTEEDIIKRFNYYRIKSFNYKGINKSILIPNSEEWRKIYESGNKPASINKRIQRFKQRAIQ